MTDLNELLERVRAATGPDREIDIALAQSFFNTDTYRISDDGECEELVDGRDDFFGMTGWFPTHQEIPTYSASIDASLALVERVLPGTASERTAWRGHYRCTLIETNEEGWHNGGKHFRIEATSQASEPLAILAALLCALISKEAQS